MRMVREKLMPKREMNVKNFLRFSTAMAILK